MSQKITQELKKKIRKEVKNGKSKYQVAKELDLRKETIYRITKDLPSRPCGWPGIRGETLELLQKILNKGFAVYSCYNTKQKYIVLKKYFPSICKVKMYGKNIFFLEDKKDVAARVFLDNVKRRLISYHEIKQITRVFDTNLSIKEKDVFLGKNKKAKSSKNKKSKEGFLLEDDGSLAFFHIRVYSIKLTSNNLLTFCKISSTIGEFFKGKLHIKSYIS